MHDPFWHLEERLLKAGVKPGIAERYIAELRDHLEDLSYELKQKGLPPREAITEALVRLGDLDALAAPMLEDDRFHSLTNKAPWLVFIAAPILVYLGILGLVTFSLISAVSPGSVPPWFRLVGGFAHYLTGGILPVLGAWLLTFISIRQRTRRVWLIPGIAIPVILASSVQLAVTLSASMDSGAISVGIGLPSAWQILVLSAITLIPVTFVRHLGSKQPTLS
nr:permease prefix domain 1-containing protein [Brucella intermedia]